MTTKKHIGILSLGVILGGGLATAVLTTGCPMSSEELPPDDAVLSSDIAPPPPAQPDDFVAPTKCVDGWRGLGVVTGQGGYTSMAVNEGAAVLALANSSTIELWDIRSSHEPRQIGLVTADALGEYGAWGEIVAADWGFLAIGAHGERRAHVLATIVPKDVTWLSRGIGDTIAPPPPSIPKPWGIGETIPMLYHVSHVATDGTEFVAAGPRGVWFGEQKSVGLTISSPHMWDQGETKIHPNAVALHDHRALVTTRELGLSIFKDLPGAAPLELETLANPQRPLLLAEGWLIPQTGTHWNVSEGPGLPLQGEKPAPSGPQRSHAGPTALSSGDPVGPSDGPDGLHSGPPEGSPPPVLRRGGGPAADVPFKEDTIEEPPPKPPIPRANPGVDSTFKAGPSTAPEGGYFELFEHETGRLVKAGVAPVISAFDAEDGPFDLVEYKGDLIVANSESGLLRGTWKQTGVTLETRAAFTHEDWALLPDRPQRVELHRNVVYVMEPYRDSVAIVQLCE